MLATTTVVLATPNFLNMVDLVLRGPMQRRGLSPEEVFRKRAYLALARAGFTALCLTQQVIQRGTRKFGDGIPGKTILKVDLLEML